MNTPCVPPSTCPGDDQQGIVSLTALVLLVVMLFMGQGLLHFVRQGVKNGTAVRQEMEMRLAAESLTERQWLQIKNGDSPLPELKANQRRLLDKGRYAGLDYTVYAHSWGGNIYLIATVIRHDSPLDNILEPHFMVKGVLEKEGEHYVWLGWAP
ncbi:MAG: hypothetical protein K6F95_07155 [Selenomonas sp.]|uniref:hypothetical protein n=1 Tax=Selenomonas sp. TaxID=2053611 RepID=UPI0025D2E5CE|nr:hypothetical protein [Selenomonas sp.]MCR5757668.1 hypothetical protein [Selenomonas sp.]